MATVYTIESFSAFQATIEATISELQNPEWYEPFDPFILETSGIRTKEIFGPAQTKTLCSINYILNDDDEGNSETKKDFQENEPTQPAETLNTDATEINTEREDSLNQAYMFYMLMIDVYNNEEVPRFGYNHH